MKHGRLLVALAVTCVPTACGGGSGSSNMLSSIRGVWEAYVRVDCAKGHECRAEYPGTQADFEFDYGASVAECTSDIQSPEFEAAVSAYEEAAAAGRLSYDAAKAKTCFDAWAAQGCGPYWLGTDPSPVCDEIFKGTVATGGACTIPDECVSATCTDQMTCS
jgi:hypothetical protein